MSLYHIHINGLVHPLSHQQRIYMLRDGSKLDIDSQPAWCYGCKRFVEVEKIESVAELDRQLAELQHFYDSPGHIPPDRIIRIERLPVLRTRRIWRAHRESPPRCLECGSTSIAALDESAPFTDAPGMGRCEVRIIRYSGVPSPHRVTYSPEGELVGY
jgi:hypothetical protein